MSKQPGPSNRAERFTLQHPDEISNLRDKNGKPLTYEALAARRLAKAGKKGKNSAK